MLPVLWLACAAAIVTSAVRSRRHWQALRTARVAVCALYLGAGAAVNAYFLLRGDDYAKFADGSYIGFVRDTWRSLVVPNHHVFISFLIVFEVAVGVLAVMGGRKTQLAYVAAIAFHVALVSFGWGFYLWSVPMIAALTTLLCAEGARRSVHLLQRDADPSVRVARMPSSEVPRTLPRAGVDLYWIPLGAGARSVRFNGIVYEAVIAAIAHRRRLDLYHSAIAIDLPAGRYMVEMTPVPDALGRSRGVVAEGPVGLRPAGRLRVFRYEVRRWLDGVVPDLSYAVGPVRVTDDPATAQRIFDLLPLVPKATWGRDELRTGEMWTCNSIISWTLASAGVDVADNALPARARAPGWTAGRIVAARTMTDLSHSPGQSRVVA